MTQERLRLALAGFGRLAQSYYLPALRALPRVDIVEVVDPLPDSRAAASAALPAAALRSRLEDIPAETGLDGLLVSSPPSTHLAAWRWARQRGVDLFMEKPFPLPAEAEEVGRSAGPAMMLNLNRRHWVEYRRLRAWALSGRLGTLRHLRMELVADPTRWNAVTGHREVTAEGGALADLGPHVFDLVAWLSGQAIREVTAERPDRDRWSLALALEGGAVAECLLGYGPDARERVTLTGALNVAGFRDPNRRAWMSARGRHGLRQALMDLPIYGIRGLRRSRSMMRASIAAALRSFITARELPGAGAGLEDGLGIARLLAAAEVSAAGRGPVGLAPSDPTASSRDVA